MTAVLHWRDGRREQVEAWHDGEGNPIQHLVYRLAFTLPLDDILDHDASFLGACGVVMELPVAVDISERTVNFRLLYVGWFDRVAHYVEDGDWWPSRLAGSD